MVERFVVTIQLASLLSSQRRYYQKASLLFIIDFGSLVSLVIIGVFVIFFQPWTLHSLSRSCILCIVEVYCTTVVCRSSWINDSTKYAVTSARSQVRQKQTEELSVCCLIPSENPSGRTWACVQTLMVGRTALKMKAVKVALNAVERTKRGDRATKERWEAERSKATWAQ